LWPWIAASGHAAFLAMTMGQNKLKDPMQKQGHSRPHPVKIEKQTEQG